jgi:hypothetical protein
MLYLLPVDIYYISVGKYLFLVPFRNTDEPQNGQRGHGLLTRVDMNQISYYTQSLFVNLGWKGQISVDSVLQEPATNIGWKGVTWIDLTVTQRFQTPNASDYQLRGFYGGFACKITSRSTITLRAASCDVIIYNPGFTQSNPALDTPSYYCTVLYCTILY